MDIESLVHKAITDYAGASVRVASLEESIRDLKAQLSQVILGVNECLRIQATILEKLNANSEEHKSLHRRDDEASASLESLANRVEAIERGCLRTDHNDVEKRVDDIEKTIRLYDRVYSFWDSKIGYALVACIAIGAITDFVFHYDLVKKLLFK